jgi:excisionase family DNA binding protein
MHSELPLSVPPPIQKTKPEPKPVPPEAEVVSVGQCCRVFCIGRSKLYELLADGTLPSLKIGKRRLIRLAVARQVFARLECTGIGKAA